MARHELTPETIDFVSACGAGRPVEIVVDQFGDSERTSFELERPFLLVGRSTQCDLRLTHPAVSFRHAYLQMIGGRLMCVDLASRTGIRWEGGTRSLGWLEPGEQVSVGPFRVCHTLADESEGDSGGAEGRNDDLPRASLEFLNAHERSHERRSWPVRREVTLIGSSGICKVQLRHESVSKVHSSLVLTPRGVWVVDLLGRGGTRVNGAPVRFAKLQDGDELYFGRFRMALRLGSGGESRSEVSHRGSIAIRPEGSGKSLSRNAEPSERSRPARRAELTAAIEPAEGMRAAPCVFSEEFVLSLVGQFASMQQQLFAQTQQQMALLTQVFSSMHHSQQELIREDLLRVHEITRELQQVHSQVLREQALERIERRDLADSLPHSAREGLDVDTSLPLSEEKLPPVDSSRDGVSDVRIFAPAETPSSSEESASSQCVAASEPSDTHSKTAEDHVPESPRAQPVPESLDEEQPRRNHEDVDNHAWLTERMRILEQEREGRWQKIMRALAGARN